jgi:hypothetical protein
MFTASVLLIVIGFLGAFDIAFFHHHRAQLTERVECRREAWIHVVRGPVYAAQFVLLPNFRFHGAWSLVLFVLFAIDALVAALDVLAEPAARRSQGGLSGGEYFMHVLLSVLVGALIHASLATAWTWRSLPTTILLASDVPLALRGLLAIMATVALVMSAVETAALIEPTLPSPRPIHVSVRLPTTVAKLWAVTQDHHLHPSWDHRFDRITMLALPGDAIRTGTRMLYEKTVLGMTVRGEGRYKLHRPLRQSTFEFDSDDPRSLIRRGVGLWLYRSCAPGIVEFSTSYTYEVRWGSFGRLFDRLIFRPLFQRMTEQSFRRLAHRYFGVPRPIVLGAVGRRPARFAVETHEAIA